MKTKREKLGVALVGLGLYSEGQLGPALMETKHCYLAGVASGSDAKKEQWRRKYDLSEKGIYSYANFDAIESNDEIDIVYVVLPNSLHAEYTIRAARAGKHVICEKPMALSVDECDQMIAACERAGVMLTIGYRLHYDPFNQEMMRLASENVYGKIRTISASHGLSTVSGWRLKRAMAGGGPLMDVGIYCVNAGRYITHREPLAVQAVEGVKSDGKKFEEIEESVTWTMEYETGIIAECSCSYSKYGNHLRVEAEDGWFGIAPAYSYNGLRGETTDGKMIIHPINQQAAQMDDFALAIRDKQSTRVPAEMGRQDMKIIEAIYRSMKSGQRITI